MTLTEPVTNRATLFTLRDGALPSVRRPYIVEPATAAITTTMLLERHNLHASTTAVFRPPSSRSPLTSSLKRPSWSSLVWQCNDVWLVCIFSCVAPDSGCVCKLPR
ncbi:hypothetical protein C8Q77DRAFT_356338 [Trametes polyzona]|nr:hypothetical protein C8Q77DRAFT_356338 [Trametes polyzona]